MTDLDISVTQEPGWLTGQLLLAMPNLRDARFAQSVIFICAHNADGAMGLILNRLLRKPKFEDQMQQLGVEPHPPRRVLPISQGGPVDEHRGFVLHSTDWTSQGSLTINGAYGLSANLDILQAIADGAGPTHARLLLGYAGWGSGQLEEEIQHNSWLTAPPDDEILYGTGYQSKWQRAFANLKIDPGRLSGDAGRA